MSNESDRIRAHLASYEITVEQGTRRDGTVWVSNAWAPVDGRKDPAQYPSLTRQYNKRYGLTPAARRILNAPHTPVMLRYGVVGDGSNMIAHVDVVDRECAAALREWLAEAPARQAADKARAKQEREAMQAREAAHEDPYLAQLVTKNPIRVLWCCLNGSTADGEQDDPSLRRMMSFAQSVGANVDNERSAVISPCGRYRYSLRRGSMVVTNLYGWRATDPKELNKLDGPTAVGPENDNTIATEAERANVVIVGWGASLPRGGERRARAVLAQLATVRPVHCYGRTKSGQPRHPLYLPATAALERIA